MNARRKRIVAGLGACLMAIGVAPALATPSGPAPAKAPLWIGAAANRPTPTGVDGSLPVFDDANALIGPLSYRRCFDKVLPATFQLSCARDDRSRGYRSFVSWKPPGLDFAGAAAGVYDAQITAWAKSVPVNIGLYATVWHEPENDMTGPQFVAMFQRVYTVVKAANPSITFGPVHMAYWWHEGSTHYAPGGPNAWWVWSRYADFVGVDTYAANPMPLKDDPRFQGWLRFVNAKAADKPLVVAEYGRYAVKPDVPLDPAKQALRARLMAVDEIYLRSMRFTMWLYWHGVGDQGDWRLTDGGSQAAWRAVASHGRRS